MNASPKGRAWIELDMQNLAHNIARMQALLGEACDIMAVLKADAYGHGHALVARRLQALGVKAYAVATLEEGIQLREAGIDGEILILGYIHPDDVYLLYQYELTQTVIDLSYAQMLNACGFKIKVHIKIDSGMHRLGIMADDDAALKSVCRMENLSVTGVFTHLCASDSLREADVDYSKRQIDAFYHAAEEVKRHASNAIKLHIQSTYGALNHPQIKCDYARLGLSVYGVLCLPDEDVGTNVDLKPVLSVRTRVVSVKEIKKGDVVGYGRAFCAPEDMRIAVLAIGYADGVPRNYGDGVVLMKGQRCPIVGRICMDMMMVDVRGVTALKVGEVVTVVGCDGAEQIRVEEIAEKCGTISIEVLCQLGSRLNKIVTTEGGYKNSGNEKLEILRVV